MRGMQSVVSCTVTVKLHPLVFPLASVAAQRTVERPGKKVEPDGGVQTTRTLGSHTSKNVVLKKTCVPVVQGHSTVTLVEQEIWGGVVSTIVTRWLHTDELEQESVARQVRNAENV